MNLHTQRGIITTSANKTSFVPLPPADPSDHRFPQVVEALGGGAAWAALPVLDIGERLGGTGYIDWITPKDMSAPIMRGTDSAGRPFVAIRMKHNGIPMVETLFRRYSTGSTWTSGCHRASQICIGAMDADSILMLSALMKGPQRSKDWGMEGVVEIDW